MPSVALNVDTTTVLVLLAVAAVGTYLFRISRIKAIREVPRLPRSDSTSTRPAKPRGISDSGAGVSQDGERLREWQERMYGK